MICPRIRLVVEEGRAGSVDTAELVTAAERWSHMVAAQLGLPVPGEISIHLHRTRGIAWAEQSEVPTLHLFRRQDGSPDLDQLPHELVHAVARLSPNRLLSEGLAVDTAARLPRVGSCWPAFRLEPDYWVAHLRASGRSLPGVSALVAAAASVNLRAAPDDGGTERVMHAWTVYIGGGSLVGFLRRTLDRQRFWEGYACGRCWSSVDDLFDLEHRWLASLPTALSARARALLAQSLKDSDRLLQEARQ